MRILFDANVIMDFIAKREPFTGIAEEAIGLCMENSDIQAGIAAHTIPNLFYILRKHLTLEQSRDILLGVTVLESAGFIVDPIRQILRKTAAIPLK